MNDITRYDGQSPFDQIKQTRIDGSEYWSARDLMAAMGYRYWKNFETPLQRAISSARNQQQNVEKNFTRSGKKSTGGRPAEDYELSRFACYLVAMNGDPNMPEVAAAQAYFAIRTREAEVAPKQLTGPELVATALIEAQSMLEAKDRQITELAPKAESFDGYLSTVGDYSINEAAKLLRRRGVPNIGQNRLRDHLLEWRWIYRGRKDRLRAAQAQIDNGRMAELTSYYYDKVTGEQKAGNTRPRVTAKGLDAIQKRLTRDLLPIEDGVA